MWCTFAAWLSFPSALWWKQPWNTKLLKSNRAITILHFLFLKRHFFYQRPLLLLINLSDRPWSTMLHLNLASQAFKLSNLTGNKEFISQHNLWWKELIKKVWMMYWLCFFGFVPGRDHWKCPLAKDSTISPTWTKRQTYTIKPTPIFAFHNIIQQNFPTQRDQVDIFRFLWLFLKSYLVLKYGTC